jgi:hypothetical protein
MAIGANQQRGWHVITFSWQCLVSNIVRNETGSGGTRDKCYGEKRIEYDFSLIVKTDVVVHWLLMELGLDCGHESRYQISLLNQVVEL